MLPGSSSLFKPVTALAPAPRRFGVCQIGSIRGTSRKSTSATGRAATSTARLRRNTARQLSPLPTSRASSPARPSAVASSCSRLGSSSPCWAPCTPPPIKVSRLTSRRSGRLRASASFRPASTSSPADSQLSGALKSSPAKPAARAPSPRICSQRALPLMALRQVPGPGPVGSGHGVRGQCWGPLGRCPRPGRRPHPPCCGARFRR